MKTTLTLFALFIMACTGFGQWTTIITDAANDGAGAYPLFDGTVMEYQYDATNDNVLFRITVPNLGLYPDSPSADFHFILPNGLDSGGPTGSHWTTSTQTHKSAYIYADAGGTPPSNFTFNGFPQTIEETSSGNVLCSNCVTIFEDLSTNQITYTFNRTDIITNSEMGGASTVSIGIVANIGYDTNWDDAITHAQGGASTSSFSITVSSGPVPVTSISVQGQNGISSINSPGGTLQMEALVLPLNASDNTVNWTVTNITGNATINSTGMLTAVSDGTVNVIATANDGSGVSGSDIITISNQTAGFEKTELFNLSVYPNPALNTIHIVGETEAITKVVLYSSDGKIVRKIESNFSEVNIEQLNNGIYFISAFDIQENLVLKSKFIKR